ncbi:hypothetical protein BKA61DRAFT_716022, partial [Leptodontidium sp. MPI-SDFR-AT-0119]
IAIFTSRFDSLSAQNRCFESKGSRLSLHQPKSSFPSSQGAGYIRQPLIKMAPTPPVVVSTPILNSTCAIEQTSNFTLPPTNITNCYLAPLQPPETLSALSLLGILLIVLGIAGLIALFSLLTSFLLHYPRYKLVTELRNTPSYELHEKVERLYAHYHDLEDDPRFMKGPGGRIRDVHTHVDEGERRRTITITEDLTKEPGAKRVRESENGREGSRWGERQVSGLRVRPNGAPRRAGQIPSLPLAADRSAWPEAARPSTPSVIVTPQQQQTRIGIDAPEVACGGDCGVVLDVPPPAYTQRE